ncbi:GNAT family N-acetyltransferase [Aurantimonas sp. 22II-16-19i]|uniref:GNAT family N-acetyltransferase n=1 Tax=Aurantimonas sp. 22II-16-19i TaxID=1317114 RepID=UPI0009F7C9B6|nr:GNAT family N-acetyltransferase [Aurantimonas sp. 22II-16-19i]ORE97997.1 GCN5-related N-acetyltransferase [Aurantimonas sp. 22II-16-19i]
MTRSRTIIETFDPARHDRTAFSCGIAQVDNFFRKTANKLQKADNIRVRVMSTEGGDLVGFYAVNAHAVAYDELPGRFARNRPGHGLIPAAYISMIGVDRRFQGSGYGGDLLVDCLVRLTHVAETLGTAVVMLDILDCGNPELVERQRLLYRRYGFEPLPSAPMRMALPMATIRELFRS